MMKRVFTAILLFAGVVGSAVARPLNVMENFEGDELVDTISVDEVVVKTFKYKRSFATQPVAATTFNAIGLENKSVVGIKDLTSYVPNFYMPDYGSKLTSAIYIRGIGSKINSPSVGLYVDGVPYFEKSAFDFEFSDIDFIDVLRGPQGTLFGRNTMGGIVNIHTKSPLNYSGTDLKLSLGNYGETKVSVSNYGAISPKLGYGISGNFHHNNGYFTNSYNGEKADDLDAGSGRIRLEWRPTDKLTFMLSSSVDRSTQNGYAYAIIDTITNELGEINCNDPSEYNRTISTTGLSINYKGEKVEINAISSYQFLKDFQGIDQDMSDESLYYVTQNQKQNQFSQEFNIKGAGDDKRYQWLFGAFGFHQSFDKNVVLNQGEGAFINDNKYDSPISGAAIYHNSIIKDILIKGLDLALGLRYDYEKAKTDYESWYIIGENETLNDNFIGSFSSNQISPKAALNYVITDNAMIYTSATKGFKAGGFNTSFESEEDKSFDPEESWSYEIGGKFNIWDGKAIFDVALFYIDWKNQQIYQPLPSGVGQMLKNAGRSVSRGGEISILLKPFSRFSLQAAYGYTNATFTSYDRSEELDYAGNFIPQVPAHTFSSTASYTWSDLTPFIERLSIDLNYKYIGKVYWNDSNSQMQEGYQLLSSNITLQHGKIRYSIWGNNLTNSKYLAYYFESFGNGYGQASRPTTFGLTVATSF